MLKKWWPFGQKKEQIVWRSGPVPECLNESQLKCVSSARWNYNELKTALKKSVEFPQDRVANCFWQIIFAHFRSFTDLHSGYMLDLTVPRVIERTRTAMNQVLLPKLEEIIRCEDEKVKSLLTYQYVFILMAAAFDPAGGTIHYSVLREVLDASELHPIEQEVVRRERRKFLEPLGFKPHVFKEDGTDHTTWYWPRI